MDYPYIDLPRIMIHEVEPNPYLVDATPSECGRFYVEEMPMYFSPKEKYYIAPNVYLDEAFGFPIEPDDFYPRTEQFIGYRYQIISSNHETVSIGPDPMKLGWTSVSLAIAVCRIRMRITGKDKIEINHTFDPIFPPQKVLLQNKTSEIGKILEDWNLKMFADLNSYYLSNRI